LTSGKTDASLLEQFRIGKLAPRRELSADHPDKPQVGSDESLPGQRTLIFEQSQLLVRGISETCACHSSIPRQQAGFDRPLQLDNVSVCQQRFMSCIVGELGHAHTLKQRVSLATPIKPKSVDNPRLVPCSRIAQGIRRRRRSSPNAVCDCAPPLATVFRSSLPRSSARDSDARRAARISVFGADAAGMQGLTSRLQHHQLRKHLVVLVLFLNRVRTLQPGLQRSDGTDDCEQLKRC
jgi:hypothetical protein